MSSSASLQVMLHTTLFQCHFGVVGKYGVLGAYAGNRTPAGLFCSESLIKGRAVHMISTEYSTGIAASPGLWTSERTLLASAHP